MSDPNEILERRLNQAIQHRKTEGLHFFCQIGGRNLEEGMTTLQMSGNGWTLLGWRNLEDDAQCLHSIQMSWKDQKHLFELLLEYPFWEASPARRDREGEEKNVHLRLSDRDRGTYSGVHFWDTEMSTFPDLKFLMWDLCQLIQNISEGDIPFILEDSVEEESPARRRARR